MCQPRAGAVCWQCPWGCQAVGREMSLTPGRRERGMNEGAVQRRVTRAHLPATVPPLCRLLLRSLPRSRLSSWASTSLLWGSKIRVFTACELCLSGCPPLFVHPSCVMRTTLWRLKSWSCHCPCQPRSPARLPGGSAEFTSRSYWHFCCVLAQGLLTVLVVGVPTKVAPCPRPIDGCSLSNYFYLSVLFFPLSRLLPLML